MSTVPDPSELTEEERGLFQSIIALAHRCAIKEEDDSERLALIRCTMDGEERAALAVVQTSEDGSVNVVPLGLVVTNEMFSRMEAPE